MSFEYRSVRYRSQEVQVPIPDYPYVPFDATSDEIRLVKILAGQKTDELLRCELAHYTLADAPYYTALSYECGDPSKWTSIMLGDLEFPVTRNLLMAMRQLQSTLDCPLLWIDAISINQVDIGEKNATIQKMHSIYHAADTVAVCIGPHADGSVEVMALLKIMLLNQHKPAAEISTLYPPYIQTYAMQLRAFLQRSYWTRVWMIQEIALATQLVVHCGDTHVEWAGLDIMLEHLTQNCDTQSLISPQLQYLWSTRAQILDGNPISLLQAVYDSTTSAATVALDKVYALLGLAFDRNSFVSNPKYELTPKELCLAMTKSVTLAKKNADIVFLGPRTTSASLQLPSWCPNYLDWTPSSDLRSLVQYVAGQSIKTRCGEEGHRWHALGDTALGRRDIVFEGSNVHLSGVMIGEIVSLGCLTTDPLERQCQYLPGTGCEDEDERGLYNSLNEALIFYSTLPLNKVDGIAHRHDTLTKIGYYLFNFDESRHTGYWDRDEVRERHRAVIAWRERNSGLSLDGKPLRKRASGFGSWHYSGQYRESIKKYAMQIGTEVAIGTIVTAFGANWSPSSHMNDARISPEVDSALVSLADLIDENLRIMVTDQKRVGWTHPNSHIGDKIYLLKGCSMPAVLRPAAGDASGNTYMLVGHAYVDGAMTGEIWDAQSKKNMEKICLV